MAVYVQHVGWNGMLNVEIPRGHFEPMHDGDDGDDDDVGVLLFPFFPHIAVSVFFCACCSFKDIM